MSTETIAAQISKAFDHERRTGTFRSAAFQYLTLNGRPVDEAGYQGLWSVLQGVFIDLPRFMSGIRETAAGTGFEQPVADLIVRLEAYWTKENDILPDSLGLIGILDDAYCCLCSLDNVSKKCLAATGKRLVAEDLAVLRSFFRVMIGEPAASRLDELISAEMHERTDDILVRALAAIAARGGAFPQFPNPDINAAVDRGMALARPMPRWR